MNAATGAVHTPDTFFSFLFWVTVPVTKLAGIDCSFSLNPRGHKFINTKSKGYDVIGNGFSLRGKLILSIMYYI